MGTMESQKRDILQVISTMRKDLAERYTVERIGVFGSFARGEAGHASDVDILVELGKPTFDNYMDLKFRLEEAFNRSVDLVMADTVKPRRKPVIDRETIYA